MYGLGSFVKSIGKGVKSAVSGVKDFVKSDMGKAALLAAGGYYLGGGNLFGLQRAGMTGFKFGNLPGANLIKGGIESLGLGVPKGEKPTFGQFAKVFGLGSLGGMALQALQASGAEEGDITDIDALRSYLRQGYRQLNPEASDADIDAFVEQNTVEYRANGGRIGYNQGTGDPTYTGNNLEDLPRGLQIDTTTRNPIPEDALPKEIEMISKIMLGPGSAGIGEPEDGTMKGYQFFKDRYLPKKVKELSENFGYSEDDIYKMINTRVREYLGAPGKPLMAEGGRIRYAKGTEMASVDDPFYRDSEGDRDEHSFRMFNKPYKELNEFELEEFQEEMMRLMNKFSSAPDPADERNSVMEMLSERYYGKPLKDLTEDEFIDLEEALEDLTGKKERSAPSIMMMAAEGGRIGYAMGDSAEKNAMQASGIMGLPLNQNPAGITELDLRETGGFIPPVGVKEKADDIPAMLSNNEFVFTADAVRGMGGGNVEKGAQRLYDQMKMLEEGGKVA
tara:strand:- start:238 stop:1752 length:1515 start_codon:yes stop_codon:yes gene_type:complete